MFTISWLIKNHEYYNKSVKESNIFFSGVLIGTLVECFLEGLLLGYLFS